MLSNKGFIEKLGDGVKYNLTKNGYNVFIHEVYTLHSSRLYINSNIQATKEICHRTQIYEVPLLLLLFFRRYHQEIVFVQENIQSSFQKRHHALPSFVKQYHLFKLLETVSFLKSEISRGASTLLPHGRINLCLFFLPKF